MHANLLEPSPVTSRSVRTRVLVVEDHPMIRAGICTLLAKTDDLSVGGEADSVEAALATYRSVRPDVVCLDLILGEDDGFQLIDALRDLDPAVKIVVVSVRDESAFAERCLEAGALGYVMKTQPTETVVEAIRCVRDGGVFLSKRMAMTLLTSVRRDQGGKSRVGHLSDRELEVFQLIGLGLSSRQIAGRLSIAPKTVETHRENIKSKLGISHAASLAREARAWVQKFLE